nr:unnamed protein product [Digitaria exilis]
MRYGFGWWTVTEIRRRCSPSSLARRSAMVLAPAPRGRCMAHGTRAQASHSLASCISSNELGMKIVSVSGRVWGSPLAIPGSAAVVGPDAGDVARDDCGGGVGGGGKSVAAGAGSGVLRRGRRSSVPWLECAAFRPAG